MSLTKSWGHVKGRIAGLVALMDADTSTCRDNRDTLESLIWDEYDRVGDEITEVIGSRGNGTTSTVNILFKSTGADEVKAKVQEIKKELQACVDLKAKLEG